VEAELRSQGSALAVSALIPALRTRTPLLSRQSSVSDDLAPAEGRWARPLGINCRVVVRAWCSEWEAETGAKSLLAWAL